VNRSLIALQNWSCSEHRVSVIFALTTLEHWCNNSHKVTLSCPEKNLFHSPPHISNGLAVNQSRASAVRTRRLTYRASTCKSQVKVLTDSSEQLFQEYYTSWILNFSYGMPKHAWLYACNNIQIFEWIFMKFDDRQFS